MGSRILVFFLVAFIQVCNIAAETNGDDLTVLNSLKTDWNNTPPNWVGPDPCGSNWTGIKCNNNSSVTSIALPSMRLRGQLAGDISSLSDLQILDLQDNKELSGTVPTSIGNLKKLTHLLLANCSFSGSIPDSIGSLKQLNYLALNSNGFTGKIPPMIGNLSNLYMLDLSDNKLSGPIPVSSGTTPGLDMLLKAKHFHLHMNELSGPILPQLFTSEMSLIHVHIDSNKLTGSIPYTLGFVQTLESVGLGGNSLSGTLPSNLNNLTSLNELDLSNNLLSGPLPNLTGMSNLASLDLSNNSFYPSDFPLWFSTLLSLTTLMMEHTELQGQVPTYLFSLSRLKIVVLRNNLLNGTLDIGTGYSDQLQRIDLQNNRISDYKQGQGGNQVHVILTGNPVCEKTTVAESYCSVPLPNSSYVMPRKKCLSVHCISNQISSPNCKCAYPYTGLLGLLILTKSTDHISLEESLMDCFESHHLPVDSIYLSHPRQNSSGYLQLKLEVFPSSQDHFNESVIYEIGFVLSNLTLEHPDLFASSYFVGDAYTYFDEPTRSNKSPSTGIIIGAAAGGSVLLLLMFFAGLCACHRKKRAARETEHNIPSGHFDLNRSSGDVPQLKGARCFSYGELKKYTNNFSEANNIGSGGYGKVYKGILPTGQMIAIKRAQQGSLQGVLEFKTEIELLSRVHHKNVVSLLGFCSERGEQLLIYEFVPNGSLKDSLAGKTGIRLDWVRRIKVALDAARGLAYLHEHANPPVIHRDVKSSNILLDECLNSKVADFGISKPMCNSEQGHITTQVKGTAGYLDPEYHMSQLLTEKSDVYSFGVLMLELLNGRRPLEQGKYIVKEIRTALDRTKDLYNLHELIDPSIGLDTTLKGLDKFVDLAMKCVEDLGADRPTMGEVVKEIEDILQLPGLNPNPESTSTSASYEEVSKGSSQNA